MFSLKPEVYRIELVIALNREVLYCPNPKEVEEKMSDWTILLKSYRREKGLKQEALAYMLNVDQTTISRWERGKDNPSLAIEKRLRDLY